MMRDVDFRFVFIGIETPEMAALASTQKKQNLHIPVSKAIRKICSYGMIVNGGFIIGFDNESSRIAENMVNCIQDAGISMAMVGTLYALPKTQLARRLRREGRLFEDVSTLSTNDTQIDQTSSGLNFITARPRIEVLKDYVDIIKYIYNPRNYFIRVTYTGRIIKCTRKYKPNFAGTLKAFKTFIKLSAKLGCNRKTGWYYWKMLFTVLVRNPGGIESAVNLAAMFLHFTTQSKFIIDLMGKEIERSKHHDAMNYLQTSLQDDTASIFSKEPVKALVV